MVLAPDDVVIPIAMSSATLTKWKTGLPPERKMTKSFSSVRSTRPRMASSITWGSPEILKKTAPSFS